MMYRGDIRLGETIDIKFTTRRFLTGVPFTLAGSPAVAAYVGNGTTEITAGITLSVDFDSRTGLNNIRVVATSGNGFATGTNVDLVLTAGTVDSVSVVGEVVGSFSIENRSAVMPTTSGRTLDVSANGEAGIDWANVGGASSAQNLSGTNIATNQAVASVSGAVASVTSGVTVTTNNDKTGYALAASGHAAMTESYAADGAIATLPQILYMIWSLLAEKDITATTMTTKKLDGSTTAMTFTLNSATLPTSVTRSG